MFRVLCLTVTVLCSSVFAASAIHESQPQSRWLIGGETALEKMSGITVTERPPFKGQRMSPKQLKELNRYLMSRPGTDTVKVGRQVVFVSIGATPSSTTVNNISLVADTVRPTLAQRVAFMRLATGLLGACYPEGQLLPSKTFWYERVTRPWEKDSGWREKTFGPLNIGWSGEGGFGFGAGKKARPMTALFISWPAGGGRCV